MPSYHDPLGERDHLKPIPLDQAAVQLRDYLFECFHHALRMHITKEQMNAHRKYREQLLRKGEDLEHVLRISAYNTEAILDEQ